MVFDAEIDAPALAAFLDVLVLDPEAVAQGGGFEALLFAEARRGIRVNESDWRTALARATAAAAASSLETTLPAYEEIEKETQAHEPLSFDAEDAAAADARSRKATEGSRQNVVHSPGVAVALCPAPDRGTDPQQDSGAGTRRT